MNRLRYLPAIAVCVVAGLGSRAYGGYLPEFAAEYLGDVLWASMVYFGVCLVWQAAGIGRAMLCALVFSYGIEISQLYQADWINAVRGTRFGALALGHGFLWSDMACYTLGILLAAGVDRVLIRRGPGRTCPRIYPRKRKATRARSRPK